MGTNAQRAKSALLALMQASVDFSGVQVEYAYPGLSHEMRECVYFGDVEGSVSLVSMRGGEALKRGEDLVTTLYIEVTKPGVSVETNETRACALGAAFEAVIGTNPTLGNLTGLHLARISSFAMASSLTDEFTRTQIAYGVSFESDNT